MDAKLGRSERELRKSQILYLNMKTSTCHFRYIRHTRLELRRDLWHGNLEAVRHARVMGVEDVHDVDMLVHTTLDHCVKQLACFFGRVVGALSAREEPVEVRVERAANQGIWING